MTNIPGAADITVGTDRTPTTPYRPGDYVPSAVAIGFFSDYDRTLNLLRSLPAVTLRMLAELATEEADARGA
ncbi:hypothetical protein HCJ76_44060 [Streptomyces sp. MC1]|uniref:hypothetical protein n=1 Tax=Streptomyces sp. MC1 TaxID=295105 RepID=UPI0018CB0F71|nr:hypothetical protein [Streptomyces sp. MC1]MBG7704859.1 hypothetical protein [Streptomyces sp. MC1]